MRLLPCQLMKPGPKPQAVVLPYRSVRDLGNTRRVVARAAPVLLFWGGGGQGVEEGGHRRRDKAGGVVMAQGSQAGQRQWFCSVCGGVDVPVVLEEAKGPAQSCQHNPFPRPCASGQTLVVSCFCLSYATSTLLRSFHPVPLHTMPTPPLLCLSLSPRSTTRLSNTSRSVIR